MVEPAVSASSNRDEAPRSRRRQWIKWAARGVSAGEMRLPWLGPRGSLRSQMSTQQSGYEIADFDATPGVRCPCGVSRRAFMEVADFPGSIHRVEIMEDARVHYHKRLTETYYILTCEPGAELQLDDERLALSPGMCVMIRPGVRHRAVGKMTILNIVFPKFDPTDEWFD